ncbi:hypothetical protein LINPERHAP2_LOCUS24403 [Linum perenne]
MSLLAM